MSFNVKLFDKVVKHILEVPDRLAMGLPIEKADSDGIVADYNMGKTVEVRPPCGTAACFGGWTVLLGEPGRMRDKVNKWADVGWFSVSENASSLLGIDKDTLSNKLFYIDRWPEKYINAWKRTKIAKERAAIFAERAAQFRAWALEERL